MSEGLTSELWRGKKTSIEKERPKLKTALKNKIIYSVFTGASIISTEISDVFRDLRVSSPLLIYPSDHTEGLLPSQGCLLVNHTQERRGNLWPGHQRLACS